jgi:YegS/Rv2252/BmrU family lipid kinase
MGRRIHVIINPAAGQDEPVLSILNGVFGPAGIFWTVSVTLQSGDASRQAREALENGVDVVAAYGGDGTVMEVATSLFGSPIPLAVLPGGTANVLAQELGIPRDLAAAAQLAADERTPIRELDIGQAGERYFILRVGAGFEARMVEAATREMKDRFGVLAYSLGAVQALRDSPLVTFKLMLDGKAVEAEGTTCLVDNAGGLGLPGLSHAPDIDVSDGLLDVIVMRDAGIGTLATAAASMLNQPPPPAIVQHWKAREIILDANPPQPVQGDGELWGETPIAIKALPHAIRALVPSS